MHGQTGTREPGITKETGIRYGENWYSEETGIAGKAGITKQEQLTGTVTDVQVVSRRYRFRSNRDFTDGTRAIYAAATGGKRR